MAMARVQVNPDTSQINVSVLVPAVDPMKAKPRIAKATREPAEMDSVLADALKQLKSVDKDGNEVPAVVDAPEPGAAKQPTGGDMTKADLDAGGKKK